MHSYISILIWIAIWNVFRKIILWFSFDRKCYCVQRKEHKKQWDINLILVKQKFVIGEWLKLIFSCKNNNRVLCRKSERKTPANKWIYVTFCYWDMWKRIDNHTQATHVKAGEMAKTIRMDEENFKAMRGHYVWFIYPAGPALRHQIRFLLTLNGNYLTSNTSDLIEKNMKWNLIK